ncbi:MAG TPA: hypothetical protein VKP04_08265, partial [Ktedonobacteraceae bacterium]|nr:hypothetical protein [Ktedonobacteraceae bacterium]
MAETNELVPEELDERNKRLIQDLHRLYPAATQLAQPLARIQQRLFHGSDEMLHSDVSLRPLSLPQRTRQTSTGPVRVKRKGWQRYLSTLAAVVCAALLVGSLILVLHMARQRSNGVAGSSSHQPQAVLSLRMIDAIKRLGVE